MTRVLLTSLIALCAQNALADNNWCATSRTLSSEIDVSGVTRIEIEAVAGDLDVRGKRGAGRIVATGRACTPSRYSDRIDEFAIIEERDGNTLRLAASVPRKRFGDSLAGYMDLSITLPDDLPLSIVDTSGDIDVRDTAGLLMRDSSGDMWLENIAGDITIERDSSGDMTIRNAGRVRIDIDSSGDLNVSNVQSLDIGRDSSGDIRAVDVAGDMSVGADSSGDIAAINVAGNLRVDADGSGDIIMRNVGGSVAIPRNKRDDD